MKSALVVIASSLVCIIGILHLAFTWWGKNLHPRNKDLILQMKQSHIHITNETTVWKAWIGFNSTHSIAAILFGLIYGYLALVHPNLFFESIYLKLLGFVTLTAFLMLSYQYFFSTPTVVVGVALVCFTIGILW